MSELRPHLVFRIGVTGHRDIAEDNERIVGAVDACLAFVAGSLTRIAAAPSAQRAYLGRPSEEAARALRVVSPLAVGADRIVARAALKIDAELYAPLPFPIDEYVKDFPDSAAEFAALVARAQTFELDGLRDGGGAQEASYEAVGQYVVRNSDLLIAIWDGELRRGVGGAEAIADYAARAGVPVWWIHAKIDRPPRLIRTVADFHDPERAPAGALAEQRLGRYLATELPPPDYDDPERDGLLGLAARLWRLWRAPDDTPLSEFYDERPLSPSPLWRAYAMFMDGVAPMAADAKAPAETGSGTWETLYQAADRASIAYGDRYRSSYVLAALGVVVALASASFGGEPTQAGQWAFIVLEFLALAGIAALVVVSLAWRWHERWVAYRLMAELARKQRVLAMIGQSLPVADVHQLALSSAAAPEANGREPPEKPLRDVWVAWLFMAHRRACPPPTGSMADAKRAALEEGRRMIAEQIDYHQRRRQRSQKADVRVRLISEIFFVVTFLTAAVKLRLIALGLKEPIREIVFIAAAVSSITTAFVGVRAYAEFALLVRQSAHMIPALRAAAHELEGQAPGVDLPLRSQPLGRTLFAATTAMMQDVTGWAHLFRVKRLEA